MEDKIGLIGCGTVGQGFLEILIKKKEFLKADFDFEAKVVAISDKLKGSLLIPEGIDIERLLQLLKEGKNIGAYLVRCGYYRRVDLHGHTDCGTGHEPCQKGPSNGKTCCDFQQRTCGSFL